MSKTRTQYAEELADSLTASVSAPGSWNYSVGGNLNPTYTYSNTTIGSNTFPYTITNGASITNGTSITSPWATTASPKIRLDGEDADILVNGHSLVDAINSIRDRLNCLQINPQLEKEWEELGALGDQYRKLEKQILEKQATWDRLKAMPPPEID